MLKIGIPEPRVLVLVGVLHLVAILKGHGHGSGRFVGDHAFAVPAAVHLVTYAYLFNRFHRRLLFSYTTGLMA